MSSILIGQIVNIHGIKGELRIYPYTDDLENFTKYKEIYLDESLTVKYNVSRCRIHKNMLITKLDGIDDANTALELKNKYVYIDKSSLKPLDEGYYYIDDLLGINVIDEKTKEIIGTISYVFNTGANDIYEVIRKDNTKVYLPAISQVVKKVDIENKKMYVEIMDGLI